MRPTYTLLLFFRSLKSQLDHEDKMKGIHEILNEIFLPKLTKPWEKSLFFLQWISFRTPTCYYLELFPTSSWRTNLQLAAHAAANVEMQANYLSSCAELQRDLATWIAALSLLTLGWAYLCPRDWLTFAPFCKKVVVEVSKAQSRTLNREEEEEFGRKPLPEALSFTCCGTEAAFLKTKPALPRISHVEWKQLSGKSSQQAQQQVKDFQKSFYLNYR